MNRMGGIQPARLGANLAAERRAAAARVLVRPGLQRGKVQVAIAPLWTLLMCGLACAQVIPPASPGLRADAPMDPNRPYAQELNSSAAEDLVIAAAGSVLIDAPAAALPAWDRAVVELLDGKGFPASTTVAIADLQTTLLTPAAFAGYPYSFDGHRAYAARVSITHELENLGLKMLSRANSHALDWGISGMRTTAGTLNSAFTQAGTGEQEGLARMASYLDEPHGKGRIALLSTAIEFPPTTNALSAHGAAPGRPGISAIELTPLRLVPAAQLEQLQRMACRFQYPDLPSHCEQLPSLPATVSLFGSRFQSSSSASNDYTSGYEMNHAQVANELRAVREAKQNSDLAILSISTGALDLAKRESNASPGVLERLTHASIDAGADLVMISGPPSLGPIEIYRSAAGALRPILYGMGHLYCSPGVLAECDRPDELDSIIVRSSISADRLRLEIYPIDPSASGSGAAGTPRLAAGARGRSILERLQRLSSPFHTVIRTEAYRNTVRGVIAVQGGAAPAARSAP